MEYEPTAAARPAVEPQPAPSATPAFGAAAESSAPEIAADEPDRDHVALEALEAELAVLETDLARVDGVASNPADPQPG